MLRLLPALSSPPAVSPGPSAGALALLLCSCHPAAPAPLPRLAAVAPASAPALAASVPAASASVAASLPASGPPAPAVATTVELAIPGFEPALLVVPPGPERRPLLVATHGAWDRAEGHCELWRSIVQERAFVLCPRGRKAGMSGDAQLYYYPHHLYIEREIEAALGALREAHGERVDTERLVYAGFSQGAIFGGLIVVRNPQRFPRAVLIEGAYGVGQWESVMGQWFHRGGGQRVLFACGGWFCAGQARSSALTVTRAGAQARVTQGSGGHTYGGGVAEAVRASFAWVIEGDERWASP